MLCEVAKAALEENNAQTLRGIASFDDQVYWPLVYGAKFPKYGVVMVDEAQDLSPLNHAMLAQVVRPDGRLIACGDPKQAIYGFRGADTQSMGKIEGLRQTWSHLGLTMTFRCPRVVVERQQAHAPGFRAWHLNPEGKFAKAGVYSESLGYYEWEWGNVMEALPSPSASIAVLCRNNAPLFFLAFKLIRGGVGVSMLGSDIGKNLSALAKKLAEGDLALATSSWLGKLRDWEESESEMAKANGYEERLAGIADRAESLRAVASGASAKDVGQVVAQIERLFARTGTQVTLASIHKSKGLEWDLVVHLDPWRIPSKYAKRAAQSGDKRQLEQEFNLKYVAETRSRHTLIEANLEDFTYG